MNWFMLALITIFFWSGSDLFSKMGSQPDDKTSHWKMLMFVGAVMGAHAIFLIATGTPFTVEDFIAYLPAAAAYIGAMVFGYVGLRYIELSVSSPICNCSGAVTAVVYLLFFGETMTSIQAVAVVAVTVGVVGLAVIEKRKGDALRLAQNEVVDRKYSHGLFAIVCPLIYCALDALGYVADGFILDTRIAEEQANIAYELTFLLLAILSFVYIVVIRKEKLVFRREAPKLTAAIFETVGQFSYMYAIGAAVNDFAMSVVAPLISAYCLLSMVWSRIILKEKLTRAQYVVLAIAAVGIVLLGIE